MRTIYRVQVISRATNQEYNYIFSNLDSALSFIRGDVKLNQGAGIIDRYYYYLHTVTCCEE